MLGVSRCVFLGSVCVCKKPGCFNLNPLHIVHQQVLLSLISVVTSHCQRCNHRPDPILAVFPPLPGHLLKLWFKVYDQVAPASSLPLTTGMEDTESRPPFDSSGRACVTRGGGGGAHVSTGQIQRTTWRNNTEESQNKQKSSVFHLKWLRGRLRKSYRLLL